MEAGITEIVLAILAAITAGLAAAEALVLRKIAKLRKWVDSIARRIGVDDPDEED